MGEITITKHTRYFEQMRQRQDRAFIDMAWIRQVIDCPAKEMVQDNGRIRLWGAIPQMNGRYLRVILLSDRVTVHNAFFDRNFKP